MLFTATIIDSSGVRRTMDREAASEREAAAALRADGAAILSLATAPDSGGRAAEPPFWHPAWLRPMGSFDVEIGLEQLSSMIKTGVPLTMALETVAAQALSPRASRVWRSVLRIVETGRPLSEGFAARRRRFGDAAAALARVGEQSGELDAALLHAARHLESQRRLRSLVANALAYPLFAIAMAVGVCAFLVVGVIPKIADFLEGGGATLPAMTQGLVDLSAWLRHNGPWLIAVTAAAATLLGVMRMIPPARLALDAAALRMPVAGRIGRLAGTAAFSRAMGMLVASGVTLLEALDVSRGLLHNRRLATRVSEASDAVLAGGTLAPALKARGDFMPMLSQMVAVGETTGSLASAFDEVARFHEQMLAAAIRRFGVTIEPLMTIVTALIVGYVYVAFFLALFSMSGAG